MIEASKSDRTGKWGLQYRVYLTEQAAAIEDDDDVDDDDSELIERTSKPKSFWIGPELSTDVAKRSFKALVPEVAYDYPKAVEFVKRCLHLGAGKDGLVLDFFAGSGTLAQAVLELNAEDGATKRFLLIQLPEPVDNDRLCTIAAIAEARTRRVIKRLDAEDVGTLTLNGDTTKPDRGFRVYTLAESNFKPWQADGPKDGESLGEHMFEYVEHILPDRSADDLLYEILLKSGFPLTTPVEKLELAGKTVSSVAGGALLVCLDRELTLEVIRAIAAKKPERVVCLDSGFAGNDQLKANAVLEFRDRGVTSFRTV